MMVYIVEIGGRPEYQRNAIAWIFGYWIGVYNNKNLRGESVKTKERVWPKEGTVIHSILPKQVLVWSKGQTDVFGHPKYPMDPWLALPTAPLTLQPLRPSLP